MTMAFAQALAAAPHQAAPRPALQAELAPVGQLADLEREWTALEAVAECSPFFSWHWVSGWLQALPSTVRPLLFRAEGPEGVVALALLVAAPEGARTRWLGRHSWHMQETGDAELDEVTIEYGGLMARQDDLAGAWSALASLLERFPRDWRRLRVTTSAQGGMIATALPPGLQATSVRARPCYRVDLEAVRTAPGGYAEVLGRKARGSLRQTLRAYGELGPLRAETASDTGTALAWFDAFQDLHTRHWQRRGVGGCFARPFFGRFHRALIERATHDGFVRLTRVTAGDALLGYLYNLGWQGRVYYYNAGMNYGILGRHDRPGIASLYAAVEQAAAEGAQVFDFLAGDQEYKRRLSTDAVTLHSIDVRRAGLRATAERIGAGLARRDTLGVSLADALAAPSTQGI